MLGTDPSLVKYANEIGKVITKMNFEISQLQKQSESINLLLTDNNNILKDILNEIKDQNKFQIATLDYKNSKIKIEYLYLDELIEKCIEPIKYELETLNEKITDLSRKI